MYVKKIILTLGALFFAWTMQAQIVNGTVKDASTGELLPGASVLVKGTTMGVSTDFDGNFQIQASEGDVLVVSYIGFLTQEVTVSSTVLEVLLQVDSQRLDEVVVIGYGTTTVKDATGSVAAVTTEDFNKGNIVTPDNLLQGRVAGVNITPNGGPGAGSVIRIRGGSSLNASNDPLIVIDGLPVTNSVVGGGRNILSDLNPADIESFSVLKDASATAVYGSRASNGVIIITTKKGSRNLRVDFNSTMGIQSVARTYDVFGADQFKSLIARQAANGTISPNDDFFSLIGNEETNWQDEIYQGALQTDNNISIRGSLAGVPVRLSAGHIDQDGLRLTSNFKRSNVSLALNPSLFDDHLKININANASFVQNRFADGVEGTALRFNPTVPVYDPSSPFGGFFEFYRDNGDGVLDGNDLIPQTPFNPVASLLQRDNSSNVRRVFGNANLVYKFHFLPELTAEANFGFDESYGEGFNELSAESRATNFENQFVGQKTDYNSYLKNTQFNGSLLYKKEMGDFDLEVQGVYNYQKFEQDAFTTQDQRDPQPGSEPRTDTRTDVVLLTYIGRTNLSFFDKYLFTFSYTRDGTSRFSEENRWGNFPAAAFAWRLSDENFLKDSELFSNLKLRASWGVTGQQDIGVEDQFLQRYIQGQPQSQYIFGQTPVLIGVPGFRNEELKWEETTTINLGLDFGLFNQKITGSIDVFRRESEDLLAFAPIADGSNFSNSGPQNIGDLTIEGVEFGIYADIFRSGDFNWNVNFNATYIDREIDQLALGADVPVGGIAGGTGNTIQLQREGFAPNSFYVYNQIYDSNGRPIEGAYSDLNGDGQITLDDRYIYRNPDHDVTMGLLSNISYKNWDFAFNMRASLGGYVYNNVNSSNAQYSLIGDNQVPANLPVNVLDTDFVNTADVILSDIYVENASFLRMDNITLGYTFPDALGDGTRVRVWGGVQNAFVITNYSGIDPEIFGGIDNTIFPRARTVLVGLNFGL